MIIWEVDISKEPMPLPEAYLQGIAAAQERSDCEGRSPTPNNNGYFCSRQSGHIGPHITTTGDFTLAHVCCIWTDEEAP